MKLYPELEKRLVRGSHNVISITGGGGKTSLLTEFGYYLRSCGYSVLLTTTTKIASPKNHDYRVDDIFCDESILSYKPQKKQSVLYADRSIDIKKWCSPRIEVLAILADRFDVTLIEADGSRGLPIKYHTDRDPVIPDFTDSVIGIMGIWGIEKKAYEVAFGDDRDLVVDKNYVDSYLRDSEGLTKGMSERTHNAIIFNGVDMNPEKYKGFINNLDKISNCDLIGASILNGELYV